MAELTFSENEMIVSKTDIKGKITYGNYLFLKMAGYEESEIIGAPHNIIRHPDMPKVIFKLLWEYITKGNEVYAYVVNKSKNGDYYWVFVNITASYNEKGKIIGYYSVRRKPTQQAMSIIKPLYKQLISAEKKGGIEASSQILNELVKKSGGRYDKFILSI